MADEMPSVDESNAETIPPSPWAFGGVAERRRQRPEKHEDHHLHFVLFLARLAIESTLRRIHPRIRRQKKLPATWEAMEQARRDETSL